MIRTSVIALCAAVLAGSAHAADMPFKSRAPLVPVAYDWSGFYVGANVGYAWVDGSGTVTIGGVTGPVSGSGSGIFGGAQAGYNWQMSNWVFGVEADIQASAQKGTVSGNAGANVFTGEAKVPYFATARGRLGYAFDRALIYVTGGGVYGETKYEGTSSVTGPFSRSRNFMTYAVGAGVEYALWSRWSAKIEYMFIGEPDHVPGPTGASDLDGSGTNQFVRAGLNYRF